MDAIKVASNFRMLKKGAVLKLLLEFWRVNKDIVYAIDLSLVLHTGCA